MTARLMTTTEYDTILAGLRLLQNHLDSRKGTSPEHTRDIYAIMTNDSEHPPMTADEIDVLCGLMQFHHIQTTQEIK